MEHKIKFSIVKKAIDRVDPYCLLEQEAPSNEFDGESRKIAEYISEKDTVEKIAKVAAAVFSSTFGDEFSAEDFMEAAGEIYRELNALS